MALHKLDRLFRLSVPLLHIPHQVQITGPCRDAVAQALQERAIIITGFLRRSRLQTDTFYTPHCLIQAT